MHSLHTCKEFVHHFSRQFDDPPELHSKQLDVRCSKQLEEELLMEHDWTGKSRSMSKFSRSRGMSKLRKRIYNFSKRQIVKSASTF